MKTADSHWSKIYPRLSEPRLSENCGRPTLAFALPRVRPVWLAADCLSTICHVTSISRMPLTPCRLALRSHPDQIKTFFAHTPARSCISLYLESDFHWLYYVDTREEYRFAFPLFRVGPTFTQLRLAFLAEKKSPDPPSLHFFPRSLGF